MEKELRRLFEKRTSTSKKELVELINSGPQYFNESIKIALSDEAPICWRATWIISSAIKKNDKRLIKHIPDFIAAIDDKGDGHQRELLKVLSKMDVSDEEEGRLFDKCITIWEKIGKSPSVRVTAFKLLVSIAKNYPELKEEIVFLTHQDYIDTLSPGIKNSVLKLKKELKK